MLVSTDCKFSCPAPYRRTTVKTLSHLDPAHWLIILRGPHGTSPDTIDSPLLELFGARCPTWKAWELLIVVVPKQKKKASMIRVWKMEALPLLLALCQLPGFSFRVSAMVSTRESINHSRHAIPSACSAIVGDPINPSILLRFLPIRCKQTQSHRDIACRVQGQRESMRRGEGEIPRSIPSAINLDNKSPHRLFSATKPQANNLRHSQSN
jgi:hypothetical protein